MTPIFFLDVPSHHQGVVQGGEMWVGVHRTPKSLWRSKRKSPDLELFREDEWEMTKVVEESLWPSAGWGAKMGQPRCDHGTLEE